MNGRKEAWEKTFNISSYEPSVIVQKSQQFINDEIKCVLDIGCGNFRNSIYFAQQGISVDAIDIADMYNKLQEYSEEKRKNITFKIQDINNIEIKKKYQIIIATRIFQYLTKEEIQSLFNIARNCLDPNGLFLISFNTKGGIFNKVEIEVPKYKHKLEEIIRIGEKNNFKIVVSEEGSKVTKYVNYFDNKLKTYDVILQPRK